MIVYVVGLMVKFCEFLLPVLWGGVRVQNWQEVGSTGGLVIDTVGDVWC